MTPIPAVVTVDVSESAEDALRRCVDSGHTRLVVTDEGNTDRIRGIVHNNSLARRLMNEGPAASIEPSVKDALIVPETKPLDDLLADLQRERASIAVVVDEYGRTAGIVSVEDIVEEVVGEIADETDPAVAGVRRLGNGDWWVRGHVPIDDLAGLRAGDPARLRRLQLRRRLRVRRAGPAAQARRHGARQRLLAAGGVGAREPDRGRAHPRPRQPGARAGAQLEADEPREATEGA